MNENNENLQQTTSNANASSVLGVMSEFNVILDSSQVGYVAGKLMNEFDDDSTNIEKALNDIIKFCNRIKNNLNNLENPM